MIVNSYNLRNILKYIFFYYSHRYQCHWGVYVKQGSNETKMSSINDSHWEEKKTICIGGSESEMVLQALKEGGYNLVVVRGAGYKLLTVVLGKVSDWFKHNFYIICFNFFRYSRCICFIKTNDILLGYVRSSSTLECFGWKYSRNERSNCRAEKCGYISSYEWYF